MKKSLTLNLPLSNGILVSCKKIVHEVKLRNCENMFYQWHVINNFTKSNCKIKTEEEKEGGDKKVSYPTIHTKCIFGISYLVLINSYCKTLSFQKQMLKLFFDLIR